MGKTRKHEAVPWRVGAPPELEEALLRSMDSVPRDDGSEDIRWTCPRCQQEHFRNVLRDRIWAGLVDSERKGELPIRCECGLDHLDRPENESGCGYRTVVVVVEEDD